MNINFPKYIENLNESDRNEWLKVKDISSELRKHYQITGTRNPLIKKFHLFADKQKPIFFNSWRVNSASNSFSLCLIEYQTSYQSVSTFGASTHTSNDKYFFGHLSIMKDFGHTLIRPETLGDKIAELFNPVEIDIKGYWKFSNKYYILSNEKEKFLGSLTGKFIKYLENLRKPEIEFYGHECLFRLDKAIDLKQTIELCNIGINLDIILNESVPGNPIQT
ncbi:hypothetical protein [Carboxylicivirga caseinilyticus]|uniref:hypothetical protein n=1 Tax=Carboxylicivirga caseinilyticus TaxID=3417572 RepID=UPI003D344100|nr:hypothetical protein [Marinilabiliaceae bacterium A049]